MLESFFDISNPHNFESLPDDWYVGITDIVNSSEAVDEGKYKLVNILGASPIVGLLNLHQKDDIPFTFGGDGCAICIPPKMVEELEQIFGASRQIGQQQYGLELRAAIIPIQQIREAGSDIKVARYKVSEVYNQAIFLGDGLSHAEEILKSPESQKYNISAQKKAEQTDFSGLECRWQEVEQQGKKVITLLVKSNPARPNSTEIYSDVLENMRNVFGFDDKTNPIDPGQLTMNLSLKSLQGEIKFRTFGMSWFQRLFYVLKIEIQIILGKIFFLLGYKSSATDWTLYKPDLALNSDHRKFDDMLRVVISGTGQQLQELENFLHEQYKAGRLAYGIHVSDAAIITCMVFRYHRQHIHFVDGSDGGYVMAAKALKQRIRKLKNNS